jgi:hypothetical protein
MAERPSFHPPFSQKKYKFDESKKNSLRCLQSNIAMLLEKHHDVFTKPLGRLFGIITKTLLYHYEEEKKPL